MDKLKGAAKGVAKGGWHPPGDFSISRDTWKSDLKGMAKGQKKPDKYEEARNHQSAPLTSLRDPESFGAPPKHSAYYGGAASPSATSAPAGGLGSPVPTPARSRQQEQETQEIEERPRSPPGPYRADTTGLRTDNLPKPPVRRMDGGAPAPGRTASPSLPPRQTPTFPPRQAARPPPSLPPRMNEYPDESTPPPPPTYGEATQSSADPALINQGAAARLAQSGVSVPGFGIGSQSTPPDSPSAPRAPQLSELQERFSRMNTGSRAQPSPPSTPSLSSPTVAAAKKPPPPPPPKRAGLGSDSRPQSSNGPPQPPPLPLASKPRP